MDLISPHEDEQVAGSISVIKLDQPPKYEDALEKSKPVLWNNRKKSILLASNSDGTICACLKHLNHSNPKVCLICLRNSSASCATSQLVQDATKDHQNHHGEPMNQRKISYTQLDVNLLMASNSPPKYSELSFNHRQDKNNP